MSSRYRSCTIHVSADIHAISVLNINVDPSFRNQHLSRIDDMMVDMLQAAHGYLKMCTLARACLYKGERYAPDLQNSYHLVLKGPNTQQSGHIGLFFSN